MIKLVKNKSLRSVGCLKRRLFSLFLVTLGKHRDIKEDYIGRTGGRGNIGRQWKKEKTRAKVEPEDKTRLRTKASFLVYSNIQGGP